MSNFYVFLFSVILTLSLSKALAAQDRQYPGGDDEQDLKVQENMTDPVVKMDRKTFEQKITKGIFKKQSVADETAAPAPAAATAAGTTTTPKSASNPATQPNKKKK